eukprot:4645291-Alexandrium_andersonii.AAC.1
MGTSRVQDGQAWGEHDVSLGSRSTDHAAGVVAWNAGAEPRQRGGHSGRGTLGPCTRLAGTARV